MNKIIIIFLFLGFKISAQNFSGIVTYQYVVSSENIKASISGIPNLDENSKKMFEDKMRKSLEKTFLLTFDKYNSVYKEEQKLELNYKEGNGSWSPYGMDIAYYKSYKDKLFITEKDLMGKLFFVKDEFKSLNWVISSETKKIGNYNCQKATAKIVENEVVVDDHKSTNFFEDKSNNEEKIITAWYTIEISISNGPSLYWGLPGLILEIEENGDKLICSKVVINPRKKTKIKMPNKKSLISVVEYEEILKKKNKELENVDFTK
jgi:GLPGLI family protein